MKNKFLRFAEDFLWMMYPSICASCNRPLFTGEECICTPCRLYLPRTGFHLLPENSVTRQFWGKVPVSHATAYYYFTKGERVQRLIHSLKYKGRKDVGTFIGKLMGTELRESVFADIDVVIPIPLHESRLRQRGYNQSDCFAEGLATGLDRELSLKAITRNRATSTQTRKHRFERYHNVDNIFTIPDESRLRNKKILLVDDVVTTGSTFISCAESLLKVSGTSVFIAAIACA